MKTSNIGEEILSMKNGEIHLSLSLNVWLPGVMHNEELWMMEYFDEINQSSMNKLAWKIFQDVNI